MKRRSGFSLIELLVVIAIIAILAAILFPIFASAAERGRMTKCMYNLKNLTTAFRLYADDNGGKLPSAHVGWRSPDWAGVTETYKPEVYVQKGSIWKYTNKNKEIYRCPTDKNIPPKLVSPLTKDYAISYTMNWMLGAVPDVGQCYGRDRVAIDSVNRPSKMLLLVHEGREYIDDACFYWLPGLNPYDLSGSNKPTRIHYEGTTASYLDGHAGWISFRAFIKACNERTWDPEPSKRLQ